MQIKSMRDKLDGKGGHLEAASSHSQANFNTLNLEHFDRLDRFLC